MCRAFTRFGFTRTEWRGGVKVNKCATLDAVPKAGDADGASLFCALLYDLYYQQPIQPLQSHLLLSSLNWSF